MILPGAFDFRMKSFFVDLSGRKTYAEKERERCFGKFPSLLKSFFAGEGDWKQTVQSWFDSGIT